MSAQSLPKDRDLPTELRQIVWYLMRSPEMFGMLLSSARLEWRFQHNREQLEEKELCSVCVQPREVAAYDEFGGPICSDCSK
jgi:hypothetical protein